MAHLLADRFWTGQKTWRRPNSVAGRSPRAEPLALRAADWRRAVSAGDRICVTRRLGHRDGRKHINHCSKSIYGSLPNIVGEPVASGPITRSKGRISARRLQTRSDRVDADSPGSVRTNRMSAPVPPGYGTSKIPRISCRKHAPRVSFFTGGRPGFHGEAAQGGSRGSNLIRSGKFVEMRTA